jgi:cell division protein FtsQ
MTSKAGLAAVCAVAAAIAGMSYAGWTWLDGLVVRRVVLEGHRHADEAAVLAVARVDTGVRLLDVEAAIIADRTRRHPWVRRADVRRMPPDIVRIAVEERAPVALVLGADSRPAAYLDSEGYPLPLVDGAVYDVPLLRGVVLPKHPTQPVVSRSVSELLADLSGVDPLIDALISSFEVDPNGEITLHTAPAGTQASIEVRLGARGYSEKFRRLEAFWMQAVLSRPSRTFEAIDLRFDSQIVTRES